MFVSVKVELDLEAEGVTFMSFITLSIGSECQSCVE